MAPFILFRFINRKALVGEWFRFGAPTATMNSLYNSAVLLQLDSAGR